MRLNVLPRPGPAQPPQIIGRPSDVERLLDEAGQGAQEVERGAEAIEESGRAGGRGGRSLWVPGGEFILHGFARFCATKCYSSCAYCKNSFFARFLRYKMLLL